MTDFAGRRAIVTGGANGIGAAIVEKLRSAGAELVILDLEASPSGIRTLVVDLAAASALAQAATDALLELNGCDVLVNCAGICLPTPLAGLEDDRYHHVLAVNLHAPVFLMKQFSPYMVQAGYGRIVNVTSVHARLSEAGYMAYDVSKAGLEAATRAAAVELASTGVLVNALAPGFVATKMSFVDGVNELETEWFQELYIRGRRLPLGRAADAAEVAESAVWLASELNSYVTGQVLVVDGGLSARF